MARITKRERERLRQNRLKAEKEIEAIKTHLKRRSYVRDGQYTDEMRQWIDEVNNPNRQRGNMQ